MKRSQKKKSPVKREVRISGKSQLLRDLRTMINQTRAAVAVTINENLVQLYWNIGTRIRSEILKEMRADYGERIVSTLSRQLVKDYGKGSRVPICSR